MAEITEAELEVIIARAEAASPGPWEAVVFPNPNDDDFIRVRGLDDDQPDLYLQHEPPGGSEGGGSRSGLGLHRRSPSRRFLLVQEILRLRAELKGRSRASLLQAVSGVLGRRAPTD